MIKIYQKFPVHFKSKLARVSSEERSDWCRTFLLFCIITLSLLPNFSFSQDTLQVINKGLPVYNDIPVRIYGDVTHDATGSTTDGVIENHSHFYISGNWTNKNAPTGNIFLPDIPGMRKGWVHLDSANQTIFGPTMTHFNSLDFTGVGIKHLSGADTEIEDTLALNNHEFDANINTVLVLSTDSFAIIQSDSSGFVSNTEEGGLARVTDSVKGYFFPVGSSTGTARFRPVMIRPLNDVSNANNTFKVQMVNVDPNDATPTAYDRATKVAEVGEINPNFFHKINRIDGTSKADVTVYYNDTVDGTGYDILAYWADLSEWKNPGLGNKSTFEDWPATFLNTSHLSKGLTKKSFDKFDPTLPLIPFALAVNVEVSSEIFVPNVFSPNGDGNNDIMFLHGKGVVELQFVIFDRWGERVFETNDINTGWDGTYKGQSMNLGVFVYIAKGKFVNGDEFVKKGNFTLLR